MTRAKKIPGPRGPGSKALVVGKSAVPWGRRRRPIRRRFGRARKTPDKSLMSLALSMFGGEARPRPPIHPVALTGD